METAPPATSPSCGQQPLRRPGGPSRSSRQRAAAPDFSAPTRQGIKRASAPAEKSGERARRRVKDWNYLDERIERVADEIERLARADVSCGQLMTVPGIGPIIASATVAAIGNGTAFAKGRDFAAWLGLVPKQMSTGDRTILGRITKRGNRYLRTLFVQGARAILLHPASWAKHSFGPWLTAAARRLHRNVLVIALANKLARIALTVLVQGRSYETRVEPAAA